MTTHVARGPIRWLWLTIGWGCVGIGTVGIVLPGLPSTGFFILAAWCFSRSSPRFEQWVLDRPGIGPMVRDYRAGLGMPRTAKVAATASIALFSSMSAFLAFDGWWARMGMLAFGATGIAWILVRIPTKGDPSAIAPIARWFRVAAVAEAVTWLGLFVSMAVKYVGNGSTRGVELFGPIHGVVALAYLAVALLAARRLRWSPRTRSLALAASVAPGATLYFELWAERCGHLRDPSARSSAELSASHPLSPRNSEPSSP